MDENKKEAKKELIGFISLGCAKNLVNTEQMMALTKEAGYTVVAEAMCADVVVLNTCGFIESAKSEAIDQILELSTLKKDGQLGKIIVAGCLSQRYRREIFADLPEVDGLLGTGSYTNVVEAIEIVLANQRADFFHDIHYTDEEGRRLMTTPNYTAYMKIAEGCDNTCGFCIIPQLRGKYRSRTVESLMTEAKGLADAGVKELILIAQDTTRYGLDLKEKSSLAELLRQLVTLDFHWIRLHYLYPEAMTDELIDVVASEKKVLPYLDIPIQHANDDILKSMRRHSNQESLRALFEKLRTRIPKVVIRTSLICGLPGETEEAFEELCDFLQEQKIERAGVFQFSREEGTLADTMENQVDSDVAAHRVELVVDLQSRIMDEYYESVLGSTVEVLCEGFDQEAGCYVGRTYADSPEIDGRVLFTGTGVYPGQFVWVTLTSTENGDLYGEWNEEAEGTV